MEADVSADVCFAELLLPVVDFDAAPELLPAVDDGDFAEVLLMLGVDDLPEDVGV